MGHHSLLCVSLLAAGAMSTLVIGGCLGRHDTSDVIVLDASHSGETIHLQPGGRFSIALDTDPTSGCFWQFGRLDRHLLDFRGKRLVEKAEDDESGYAYMRMYDFTALAEGETELELELLPSDEDDVPVEEYRVRLRIEPANALAVEQQTAAAEEQLASVR